LINSHEVSYYFSVHAITEFPSVKKLFKAGFIGYSPTYEEGFSNLPNSETEVKEIADIQHGKYYTGSQATENAFKMNASGYKIIHTASHGIIDEDNPLQSRLLFTKHGDTLDDGALHVYELYNMNLETDLVTLSACNTATGSSYGGEGVIGLAHGFTYAGAPNLLTSLWMVSDEPTKDLMRYFYQELDHTSSYPTALHQAKLRFIREGDNLTADPYYWASFVLIGPPEMVETSVAWYWWLLPAIILIGWLGWRFAIRKI